MSAARLLERARRAGLTLELTPDGRVRFEATAGAPPPALLDELRAHRAELAAELVAEREFRLAAERRRIREAALARDGDLALLEAERRALATLERADRALATVEPDPALREAGVIASADPVEPLLELLATGDLEAARELLAVMAGIWLDPGTWRELELLATADPDRCRAALEAVLARDPRALDRLLDPPAPAELAEFRPVDARSVSRPRDVPARPKRAPTSFLSPRAGRSGAEKAA